MSEQPERTGPPNIDDELADDLQDESLSGPPRAATGQRPDGQGASAAHPPAPGTRPAPQAGGKPPAPAQPPQSVARSSAPSRLKPAAPPGKKPAAKPQPARKPTSPGKKPAGGGRSPTRPNGRSLPGVQGVTVKSRAPERPVTASKTQEPRWLKQLRKELPPYTDEVLALLLMAFGLLSFLSLLSPTSGALGMAWSGALQQAFGGGAFVISAVILAAGGLLLVPKLGIPVRLNWWRIVAAELFYVFVLAYLHAGIRASLGGEAGQIEAFARAFEGRGGGMVGWAIQEALHLLLGDMVTGIVLLGLIALTGALLIGIRRDQVVGLLDGIYARLMETVERLEDVPQPAPDGAQPKYEVLNPGGPRLVELPAIPGRPSIVTGEKGAGAITLTRVGAPANPGSPFQGSRTQAERIRATRTIEHRFHLDRREDKRRARKRSEKLPPLDLLDVREFERPTDDEINVNAVIIEETVQDFDMRVEVIGVKAGPTITQYAVQPFKRIDQDGQKVVVDRVRVTRVAALAKDLSLALAAPSVRIQAPVPGTNYIGVEVPNTRPGIVSLRPVIESDSFYQVNSPLALGLGRQVDGQPFAADLGSMPHLLIGGTTGSGKSVCLRSIATCLAANNTPDRLRMVMIDPKMVELIRFNGLPHLLGRVEVQLDRILGVLRWITREMERRYRLMEDAQARNIATYNHGRRKNLRLPYIVVLIDELAELMMEHPDDTEHLITRLAQMARATGIHLVVATQRPSTDVVTGLIKANFPARISFAVASGIDSRVIIDSVGAEDLVGNGDMLYQGADAAGPIRLQGCFVNDYEMERIVTFWRNNWDYDDFAPAPWEKALTRAAVLDETDEMLEDAIRVVLDEGEASASLLQRRLNVGYPRAGRLADALYKMGVVGEEQGGGRTRKVLIPLDTDPTTYIINWRMGK
jgi:S-DNA-T family DNA segregation ATPase FtsK/SpoIIIE